MRGILQGVVIGLVTSLVGLTAEGRAQDLAALKVSFAAEVEALNTRDLEAATAEVDEGVTMFSLFSPFPIRGKAAFRQAVEAYLTVYEQATFTPRDAKFRILGKTGVAWGYYQLTGKMHNGPDGLFHGRYVWTYTQAQGKWRLLSLHVSPLHYSHLRIH